jgi:hypothetical protein
MFRFERSKKLYIIIGIFLLYSILPYVSALHTSIAVISPTETATNIDTQFTITVTKQGGENINAFEILVPETSSDMPYYLVKNINSPIGWTYELRYKLGETYPYKIIWSTSDSGISRNSNTAQFVFTATTPSVIDSFDWMWKTKDIEDDTVINKFTTQTIIIPLSDFTLATPQSTTAGQYFDLGVTAIDEKGNVKKDFTGTVTFSSSDPLSILPFDYTFTLGNSGSKVFKAKLKTAGTQTITMTGDGITKTSNQIIVKSDRPTAVIIVNSNQEVSPGASIQFDAVTVDAFGNVQNITDKTTWKIDKEAGGIWSGNSYTAGNSGKWTVVASYNYQGQIYAAGITLTVKQGAAPPQQMITIYCVKDNCSPTQIQAGAGTLAQGCYRTQTECFSALGTPTTGGLKIYSVEAVTAKPGQFINLTLGVRNTGNIDLTEVRIFWSGVPYDWIAISPIVTDISVGQSSSFLTVIAVPVTEKAGNKTITLQALSAEEIKDSVNVILQILAETEGENKTATGFSIITGNKTYLGLFIAAIIILLLIIWRLFLPRGRGKKRKSEE